jgi:hypothetical protein
MRARIPVWFGTARPPFVPATLHWHVTESRATVNFVVDTGAFDIILSEDDAEDLGVDMGRLRPSKTPIGVIGGTVPSYDLHGISVAFTCDKGRTHTFGLRCMRVMANKSGRRGGPGGGEACSLLGRRFLQDNDFSLHWEFGKEKAHLGAPDRHGQEIKGDSIPWETAYAATERVLKRTHVRNRRA